jgi:hypothetical protein
MGLIGYGTYLLVAGFFGLRVISKQMTAFEAAGGDASSVGIFNDAVRDVHTSGYGAGGAAVVIAVLLILSSRRLGILIARGL